MTTCGRVCYSANNKTICLYLRAKKEEEMSKRTFLNLAAANFVAATIVGFVIYVVVVIINTVAPIPVSPGNVNVAVGIVFGLGFWAGSFFGGIDLFEYEKQQDKVL